jgi:hypothetical protein
MVPGAKSQPGNDDQRALWTNWRWKRRLGRRRFSGSLLQRAAHVALDKPVRHNPNAHTCDYANCYPYTNANANFDSYSNGNRNRDTYTYGNFDSRSNIYNYAYGYTNRYSEAYPFTKI